ncbi:MAG: acyl--CoA ligase [Hyphomicrobiales bacterium]|nr:acyl--CoA ligase [Hyphomicrobiales bacterium]MBV8825504.1 acyl--CoA ligase [Hyphomicrobiales bacterium]MBV9429430.1 acyl--CoA ligase [Bradyrhizobiaceae bacterium]
MWAHSVTDLVAGFVRDGGVERIRDNTDDTLTMARVEDAHGRLAAAGIRAGDVVLVEAENSLSVVATLLAAWLMGCAVCPVDPDAPEAVKLLIARESKARASVTPDGGVFLHADAEPAPELIVLRRSKRITGPDLALVVFTSGSSGVPKGVLLTHQNVMSAVRSISAYLQLRTADRILCVPPFFFDYGLYQLLLTMFNDCSLILNNNQTNAVMVLKLIETMRPTVLPVVPALASSLARMLEIVGKQGPDVRLITNTGGHLPDSAIKSMAAAFPRAKVVPMYGLTECKRALYYDPEAFPARRDSVGRPMPGLEAKVVVHEPGAEPREAAPDEVGELHVRGSSVMQGYHRGDQVEGARLLPGRYRDDNWLATGDLFAVDDAGLFYFRGRSKALIKQGGYCIHPRDIEILAEAHQDVVTARVVGRTEDNGDESAVLFLQLAGPATRARQKQVTGELKQTIHKTLMPRVVRFVEEWPATPNGKIDANALVALTREDGVVSTL